MAEQAGDGRLAIAEIGRKTGEAMAQDMGVMSAVAIPQLLLPIADDGRLTLDSSTVSGMLKLTAIRAHTDPRNVVLDFTAGFISSGDKRLPLSEGDYALCKH